MTLSIKSAAERVKIARHPNRPIVTDYIKAMIKNFFPLAGDRKYADDESIIGGLGFFHDVPVTVIGHRKGRDLDENIKMRFGMPNPEGYRKAERLMLQAEKFARPLITFVDTPGAYPGMEAEERGQAEAIAKSIATMSRLKIPAISVFIGEGGSGGALAIGASSKIIMLENSIYSILSPEGFASILWKDSSKWEEAAEVMKLTSVELQNLGVCDVIVKEPEEGAHADPDFVFSKVEDAIWQELQTLMKDSGENLAKARYKKLLRIGKK